MLLQANVLDSAMFTMYIWRLSILGLGSFLILKKGPIEKHLKNEMQLEKGGVAKKK